MVSVQHGRQNFYPRSPCGERPYSQHVTRPSGYFYPRSPCGERPGSHQEQNGVFGISIHALLAESDLKNAITAVPQQEFLSTLSLRRATTGHVLAGHQRPHFYPRSPCGERLAYRVQLGNMVSISIHALLAESDAHFARQIHKVGISIHALLAESDVKEVEKLSRVTVISIHALLAESDRTQSASLSA